MQRNVRWSLLWPGHSHQASGPWVPPLLHRSGSAARSPAATETPTIQKNQIIKTLNTFDLWKFDVHVCWNIKANTATELAPSFTVLPPFPMTRPAANEGTLMWASSFTSSFGPKKFSSFSLPKMRHWAWSRIKEKEISCTVRIQKTFFWSNVLCLYAEEHLKLSLWRSDDDDHPLFGIHSFCRGNLKDRIANT